jgi:uncharacterized membrane protein YidH (DUF202 family)
MKKIGIFIILLGIGITVFTTISFFSTDKDIKLGKLGPILNLPFHFALSPVAGLAIMGIGGIVFWQTYNDE